MTEETRTGAEGCSGNTTAALTDLSDTELTELIVSLGGKPFQARQISHWIWKHGVSEFAEMHNVPARLREALSEGYTMHSTQIRQIAVGGVIPATLSNCCCAAATTALLKLLLLISLLCWLPRCFAGCREYANGCSARYL